MGMTLHVCCDAGEAKLAVKGDLLGERQDAVMKLDDFPMAMLQPIFRAVPALQHAAPAVGAPGSSPPAAELLNRISIPFLKCATLPHHHLLSPCPVLWRAAGLSAHCQAAQVAPASSSPGALCAGQAQISALCT